MSTAVGWSFFQGTTIFFVAVSVRGIPKKQFWSCIYDFNEVQFHKLLCLFFDALYCVSTEEFRRVI